MWTGALWGCRWESLLLQAPCWANSADTTRGLGPYFVLPIEASYLANCSAFSFSITGDPSVCSISNPDFVIYSSVVSFYLPFGVTVLVYARIYVVLRQRRRKRILTRQNSQCISVRPSFPQQVSMGEGQREDSTWLCDLPALCPAVNFFFAMLSLQRHTSDPHLLICWCLLCFRDSKFNAKSSLIVFPRAHLTWEDYRTIYKHVLLSFKIFHCPKWPEVQMSLRVQSLVWQLHHALLEVPKMDFLARTLIPKIIRVHQNLLS